MEGGVLVLKGVLLGSPLMEGKGQRGFSKEAGLGQCSSVAFSWLKGLGLYRQHPPPTPLYHSGIAWGLPKEGPWPWARQLLPAKAIPKKGWQLRAVCQQHFQAARGINLSFQKEIWLAQFSTYYKYSFNKLTDFWLLMFNLYEAFLHGFFFLFLFFYTEFHCLQGIYLDLCNQNIFNNPILWDI